MKKLLLLSAFIIPALCNAQCPTYLDVPADSIATVVKQIENIAAVTLTANHDRDDRIDYNDATNSVHVRMFINDAGNVQSIAIVGKADVIDNLYNNYFVPAVSAYKTQQATTYIFTSKYKVVHVAANKEIDIEHL